MERSEKRGQFYLVSAIIVVAVIVGLVVIYNSARGETNIGVSDAKDEIYIEGKKVMSYGESQVYNQAQFNGLFTDFTDKYVDYLKEEKSVYFLFGNPNGMIVKGYQEKARNVTIISGPQNTTVTNSEGEFTASITPQSNKMTLSIGGAQYDFLIVGGQNFNFIVSNIIGDSEYVARG